MRSGHRSHASHARLYRAYVPQEEEMTTKRYDSKADDLCETCLHGIYRDEEKCPNCTATNPHFKQWILDEEKERGEST